MLTGLTFVFLGGDARQLEIIRKCVELDAAVKIVGFDQLEPKITGVQEEEKVSRELLSSADVLVLPIVGTNENGEVSAPFSDKTLALLDEHLAALPKHALVYTGMAKNYLRTLCEQHGIRLIEMLERDDVAIYNSIPTAEGALMIAIQNTNITIHGSNCIVLGMGRTGFTMARTLQGMGANVKIGVRRSEHYARALEMGWKPFMTADLAAQSSDIDLLFNTIPTMIVTAQIISKMPRKTVIIDLASAPGGTDFRFAEKRGIKAMLAPGLPGIVAPKTAGIILANCICQSVMEEYKTRGDEM
ncbi:dipicolinate synthase subunit A [Paenibacillus sp. CAA11]|uniref:dipicolinate synthase subunit DpsA n=1 Tax=Paenibacillus sp. CAA11 TaxID=1532905 RepID=UPI000D344892|nr:dipicolinate synthase subunit DpsA [Paenibacillus sp. CAA11]AWB44350.1 dipicolinate synthase subunit A [Paenibacillus sp. CAA11]